ncbi:hypothetical protein NQD34_003894 [Periophthalmus magnuspinnatus]|nr:hypothetical protein NQD34_003894 [Periophthalmus magnuspinnatus]
MECPHLSCSVDSRLKSYPLPPGSPSSWSCGVCRSDQNSWICLTCLQVHCGRYVNAHAVKHYEDSSSSSHNDGEKLEEKGQHCVCMNCSNYSIFCYRCDEFVVNDTALGQVQKVREHLQNLENVLGERKRKLEESSGPNSKILKTNDGTLAATGLRNLGNTCFMNAVLQSLSNIKQFSCFFKALPPAAQLSGKAAGRMYYTRSQGDSTVSLVEEVRKTLCSLWQGNQTAYSPDSLFYTIWKLMPSFRGYQQQDAHEFMRYLLDLLHRELLHREPLHRELQRHNGDVHQCVCACAGGCMSVCCCFRNGNVSVVTSLFGGVLQNEVNCLICGTESRKFDPFLDLSLDIPHQFRQKKSKDQEPGPPCTLYDCLQSFTDLEELDETELYYCLRCKKRQKSTKKFWIKKLPKVLCLHLKRFHWTTFMRNKVDTYVKFPLRNLDLRQYLLEPEATEPDSCFYDLAAVSVHHGSGVGSGHYTAYGCHKGHWYHFNDGTVTLTNEEAVTKAKAYILFYEWTRLPGRGVSTEEGEGGSEHSLKPTPAEATPVSGQSVKAQGDTLNTTAVTGEHPPENMSPSLHSV